MICFESVLLLWLPWADIAAPGAIGKIALKSAKSAKELTALLKSLQTAEGTLILETASGVGNAVKLGEIISAGKTSVFVGKELGLTTKEIGQLMQAGTLETTVQNLFDRLAWPKQQSLALHKQAMQKLGPYVKRPMDESILRKLIHETGIQTFPRPEGIPKDYLVQLSDKGIGIKYVAPKDTTTYVRVMPGKPHSPYPYQQKPYVKQQIKGTPMNKHGKKAKSKSEESHIPINEYIYREKIVK